MEHRPEAATELLHWEEARPKWKLTQAFYLGSLVTAGPAARAGFTWHISRKLTLVWGCGDIGRSGAAAEDRFTGSGAQPSRGGRFGLLLRGAGREGSWSSSGAAAPPAQTSGGAGPCPASGWQQPLEAMPGATRPEEGRGWWCCLRVLSSLCSLPDQDRRLLCLRAGWPRSSLSAGQTLLQPRCRPVTSRRNCGLRACRLLCAGT